MYNSDLKKKVFRNLVGKWNLWRTITFPIRKNSTESFIIFMQRHVLPSKDFFICWSVGFHRLPYPSLLEFLKLFDEDFSCHIWIWRHKHWSTCLVISENRRLVGHLDVGPLLFPLKWFFPFWNELELVTTVKGKIDLKYDFTLLTSTGRRNHS